MSHPSKRKGYALERQALEALLPVFPDLERTGSVAYSKAAPDLLQLGPSDPTIRLVVTRDRYGDLLVTLSVEDLRHLANGDECLHRTVVQCKKRERTWLGTLYRELKKAT